MGLILQFFVDAPSRFTYKLEANMTNIVVCFIAFYFLSNMAIAADCLVKDPDIAETYSGDCTNGLANGKGVAAGRDKYSGEFKNGIIHGKGIYTWASGSRYEGDWVNGHKHGKGVITWADGGRYEGDWVEGKKAGKGVHTWAIGSSYEGDFDDDRRNGFGVMKLVKDDPNIEIYENNGNPKGKWVNDIYVIQGLFRNSDFILECSKKSVCEKQKRREDDRKAREEMERIAHACDRFYSGKAIRFQPAGWVYFGSLLDAIVLGKGDGNVSIKITDTHFDSYGKTFEIPCTSDQLK